MLSHLQTMLAQRVAGSFNGRDGCIKHFGDVLVAQLAALLVGISR